MKTKIPVEYKKLLSKKPREWQQLSEKQALIDKYNLHDNCAKQPMLYDKWSFLSVKARKLLHLIDNKRGRIRANVELQIRNDPEKYDLIPDNKGKVMEGGIKAAISKHEKVIAIEKDYLEAYEYRNTLWEIVESFKQRLYMLREMVELWKIEYYTDALNNSKVVLEGEMHHRQPKKRSVNNAKKKTRS